jgi:hypothetical protein
MCNMCMHMDMCMCIAHNCTLWRACACACVCMCTNTIAYYYALHAHFGTLQEAVQLLLRVMEPSARAGWQARSAAEFFLAGGLTPHMLHSS